jgi:hypothetical protein
MKNYDKFLKKALNKMFVDVGFQSFDENFVKQDNWYNLKQWTTEQENAFKAWFLTEAKKDLKFNKQMCEREFAWFNLKWGWKVV